MRIKYLVATAVTLSALTAVEAKAANTATVLQFGTANVSSTSQTGPVDNTATTLQFGAFNLASSTQAGSLASVNSATIGQGGTTPTATNIAAVAQIGGANTSLIGQIGLNNAAAATQLGILNGSTILQAAP
jgi:hypothetical protein